MKNVLMLLVALCVAGVQSVSAQITTNGQNANFVIGQTDFTSNGAGLANNKFNDLVGVAVDVTNNKLYVSEFNNNRVLRFALPITSNNPTAEAVFGQADFTSNGSAVTQNGMNSPSGLAVGPGGRLWVASWDNDRVLRFDAAHLKASGANADGVLGQPDFTSNTGGTTQNRMNNATSVYEDAAGNLWVADYNNRRVLRFDNAASKGNGANADGVLGQADFTSNAAVLTQSGMSNPVGVSVSGTTLWVSDRVNHRVLRFDNAAGKGNGATADGVLGQADFTSNAAVLTQSGMDNPTHIATDENGNLYVYNRDQSRILVFNSAASKADGANADAVLGANDFTSAGTGAATQSTFGGTYNMGCLAAAGNILYVPDSANDRVLVFGIASTTTVPTIGEWSMIVLALSIFCVAVMYVRKPAFAFTGSTQPTGNANLMLGREDFAFSAKWFFPLSFVTTAVVWTACVYFGETAVRDMVGTGVTGIVSGYLLQLLVLWYFDEAQ
jgi:sugar lactone lactonase YvrE